MQAEGIIAALIGAAGGGGGFKLASRLFGPGRTRVEVRSLVEANESLMKTIRAEVKRNKELHARIDRQEKRIQDLEATVERIFQGELPPEHS